MKKFIPFALPDLGQEEIEAVTETLRSGWITTGPRARKFEEDFAQFLGGDCQALAVNSATAGLHLAVEAIGVRSGDEVITTTLTFTATAEVIRYMNAHPVFVDVDPETLCIDPKRIEAAITPRTKAIIPVHFAGMSCDMDAILDIARRRNLKVIEDAAHALPTTWKDQLIGTLGSDATIFSFYATKTLATGEGGMLVTRDRDIADRAKVMRLHGINRDAFNRYQSETPAWYYEIVAPGFKYNLTDIAAAIGIEQLKKVRRFHERRAELAARYDRELAELPISLPPRPANGDLHAWHLYVIRLSESSGICRDEFIQEMAGKGVGCSVHFIPLHLQPYWRDTYGLRSADFPIASNVYEQCVSLPLYTALSDDDQAFIIESVKAILESRACTANHEG